jgi:hypothetical protein
MDHLGLVYESKAVNDLLDERHCLLHWEGTFLSDFSREVSSLTILSYDEDHVISIVLGNDLNDVWFASELPKEVELLNKFFFFMGVIEVGFGVPFEDKGREVRVDRVRGFVNFGLFVGGHEIAGVLVVVDAD